MNIKRSSAVIFDCDGVLFDSRQSNIDFYNHLLMHFGLPCLTENQAAFVHMHTGDESILHIFQGLPFSKEALAYRYEMDSTPFIRTMIMEPGLKPLLKQLRLRFGLAIATNRGDSILKVLHWHGLEDYFDIVVSSADVSAPKPHPECLLKILGFFGIPPESAFYVGDSLVDYQTAETAGVPFIAYKNRALDAAYHADDIMDLTRIIEP